MTIKDLARQTGYSVGTISRVLNHQPNVSDKARVRIMACVEENGFQLNTNAKNLKQQHRSGILAVVTGTSNELFAHLIEQIQGLLSDTQYPLTVDYVDENDNAVLHAVRQCREKKPLGILFLGGDARWFANDFGKLTLPCVLLTSDASGLGFRNLSSVTTDDVQAAECAVEYLISNGHTHIGIISGNREYSGPSRLRYEGCRRAMARHQIEITDQAYQTARYSFQEGYASMNRMLAQKRVTAVFAMSDVMAIGAMRALQDRSYRIPEDISVFGFDGLELGDYYIPKLTTIRQQVDTLARRGVEILLDSIENGAPARHETVPFTLVVKESVRPVSRRKEGEE